MKIRKSLCFVPAFIFLAFVPRKADSQPVPEKSKYPEMKVLPEIALSLSEQDIYEKINIYRVEQGLKPIPLSKSLTYVAQTHAWDLAENGPFKPNHCNLHSWSSRGTWSSCCYTDNQARAACMWAKPGELTNYNHSAYEIAFWTDEPLSPLSFAVEAVKGWRRSKGHNEVIINAGDWKDLDWNAMGVGYSNGYAVVWFGAIPDEDGEIKQCEP
jgi:uncharacterized protein YkwD